MFACADVELALSVRKARATDTDRDNGNSVTVPSQAEKKSSFAADVWLAQKKAAKKSKPDEVSSSEDVSSLTAAKSKWTSSNRRSPTDSHLSMETQKHSERCSRPRSRSPLNSTKSSVPTCGNKKSPSPSYPVDHNRHLLAQQSRRHMSEQRSFSHDSSKFYHSREPLPAASSVDVHWSHAQRISSSSAPFDAYSVKYGREQDVSNDSLQRRNIDRNIDSALSQMKNSSKLVLLSLFIIQ